MTRILDIAIDMAITDNAKITLADLALPTRCDIPNPGSPAGDFLEGIRDAVAEYFRTAAQEHADILSREDRGTWNDSLTDGLREAAESAVPAYTHRLQVIFGEVDGWTYLTRMPEVPSFDTPGVYGPDVHGFLAAVLAAMAEETATDLWLSLAETTCRYRDDLTWCVQRGIDVY